MATKAFDMQDVLKGGWENFKKTPGLLIGLLLLSILASVLVNVIFGFLPAIVLSILNGLVTSYIMLSIVKSAVMLSNGETPDWGVLKNDMGLFLKFFIASIVLSIIFIIASILLIIPLFLAMAVFFPVPYLIVSKKDISIIDALKKSWEITTPQFISCLIFVFVILILAIAGMIPLGLGLLITVPVIYTTGAIICNKLDASVNGPAEAAASTASTTTASSAK